jgi:hypothetical protein
MYRNFEGGIMPTAFGTPVLGDSSVAAAGAFKPPSGWTESTTLPEIAANRPVLESGEKPQVVVTNYDPNSAVKPDAIIHTNGDVEYAKGFRPDLATMNVAIENGTPPEKFNDALMKFGGMQVDSKEGIEPALVDNTNGLIKPEFKKDWKDRFHVDPNGVDEGGNDVQPGPRPKPGPRPNPGPDGGDQPDGGPDKDDKFKPDKETDGADERKANAEKRALRMIESGCKTAGQLDGGVFGHFLARALPGGIQGMMDELGPPPWKPEDVQRYLEKHKEEIAKNLKEMGNELPAGDENAKKALDKFAQTMTSPEFAKGLTQTLNKAFETGALKTEKVGDKTKLVDGSKFVIPKEDVQRLFPGDSKKPAEDVQTAFSHLALKKACEAAGVDLKQVPDSNADKRKVQMEKLLADIQDVITKLKGPGSEAALIKK